MESSSNSRNDSTFSLLTPICLDPDSREFDFPNTLGDLKGFKPHGCNSGKRDNVVDGTKALNRDGKDFYVFSKPISSSGVNASSRLAMRQSFNHNLADGSDIGAIQSDVRMIPITSTSASFTPPVSPKPSSALDSTASKAFQFSFRMTSPNTNNMHTQGPVHLSGTGGHPRSPLAFPSTSTFSSDTTSKPLSLQFSTRNGQSVLSLSTPAREAAALREKSKKEKQDRCSNTYTNGVNFGFRCNKRSETHTEENWIWRNIKPAPSAVVFHRTNSYPSLSVDLSTFKQISSLQQTPVQTQSQTQSLQKYHTCVPYDMYGEMIHDSIGSRMAAQHQQVNMGWPVISGCTQPGKSHPQVRSSSQDLHHNQASQYLTSQSQPRSSFSALSSPASTCASTPTYFDAVSSMPILSPSSSISSYPIVQSGFGTNDGNDRPLNSALEQQRHGNTVGPCTLQDQYSTLYGAQEVTHAGNSTSYPHFQREASISIPVRPDSFRKTNSACTRCKRMKMKCTFPSISSGAVKGLHAIPGSRVEFSLGPSSHPLPRLLACVRCVAAGHPCIVEGRKPRTPSQREALLASLRQKDAIIAMLLAPFQPSEQNANIVLNGAKVIEAVDKRKEKITDIELDGLSSVPDDDSGSIIGLVERAALLANDKGGSANKERHPGLKFKKIRPKKLDVSVQNASSTSSDEYSLSSDNSDRNDSDEDDVWDDGAERAVLNDLSRLSKTCNPTRTSVETCTQELGNYAREGSASSATQQPISRHRAHAIETELKMHLHTLPPLNTPLGVIARLSLEGMGQKLRWKSKAGNRRFKIKIESVSESIPLLTGQKRRRNMGDGGDEERDDVVEDESMSDIDEVLSFGPTDRGDIDNSDKETASRDGIIFSLPDARSITLSDARALSLSNLVITELDGPAHHAYFAPGLVSNLPLRRIVNSRAPAPPIINSGLVTWEECETLFGIYYEYLHPYCSVLDPVLHTVQTVYERDPFLFTVILAVSSRYYTARSGLYTVAMHYAKAAAATAFVNGVKSVEMVQAYLIMCTYSLPARRWEEDRSWFYGGIAFRIATDLNLDRSFDDFKLNMKMGSLVGSATNLLPERQEREKLNRMRTWLNCFNVDRSSSTQWGKPATLIEGEPIRKAREWWRCSLYNHPYDLHLVAYTELLSIVSKFHEQVYSDPMSKTGLNKNANFQKITDQIEVDIKDWHDNTRWHYDSSTAKSTNSDCRSSTVSSHFSASMPHSLSKARVSFSPTISPRRLPSMGNPKSDPALIVRIEGVPVFENYMRLVMYSFGFEQAWRKWKARKSKADISKNLMLTMDMDLDLDGGDMFFVKCLHAASAVVGHLTDVYGPSGYLKYAPDCFFVMGGFCGAFLLKMLRPAFAPLLDIIQRKRIIQVVTRFVDTLDSSTSSVDSTHTPRLYAKFLRGALRDVMGSNASSDAAQAPGLADIATTEPTVQMEVSSSSSTSVDLIESRDVNMPSHVGEEYSVINGIYGYASPCIMERDDMGIDPALVISKNQEKSGALTPLMSLKTTFVPSNSEFSPSSHSLDIQSRWAPLFNPELVLPGNGSMGYSNQAQASNYLEHQTCYQRDATDEHDLDVGLGASLMTHNVGHACSDYIQLQSQGKLYPQSRYPLHVSHEPGVNHPLVPYSTLQQDLSNQSLPTKAADFSEDEMLATMHAVSSDDWNSSVIMPGYGWGLDEDAMRTLE